MRGGHDRAIASLAPPLIATKADADEIVIRLGRAIDKVAIEVKRPVSPTDFGLDKQPWRPHPPATATPARPD